VRSWARERATAESGSSNAEPNPGGTPSTRRRKNSFAEREEIGPEPSVARALIGKNDETGQRRRSTVYRRELSRNVRGRSRAGLEPTPALGLALHLRKELDGPVHRADQRTQTRKLSMNQLSP
jgi:hypothetical protein